MPESEPNKLTTAGSFTPSAHSSESSQAAFPLSSDPPGRAERTAQTPTEATSNTNAGSTEEKWPADESRQETKKRDSKLQNRGNWLMNDPQEWVGRKVRSRRNFAIYSVSEVYNTGRVKLERNWMTYLTEAETVRTQYDPLS